MVRAYRSNIKVVQVLQVKYKGKTELAGQVKCKGFPEGFRSNIMVVRAFRSNIKAGQSVQVK